MSFDFSILNLAHVAIIIMALSVHEFSHAWAANKLGDPTPRMLGRLTLNPLAHLDIFGLIMLVLVRFGWGKAVPFNPQNFRNPKLGVAITAAAGPLSNLAFALLLAISIGVTARLPYLEAGGFVENLITIFQMAMMTNIILAIFNLIPIPPLDGSKIVSIILPYNLYARFLEIERYGFIILIVLINLPIFRGIIMGMASFVLMPLYALIDTIVRF